jgi:hypothetical protein
MFRLFTIAALVAASLAASPVLANQNGGGTIGRGCTLDPFNHTMRCIDFDHCTLDKNGNRVCPVVVTTSRATADNDKGSKPKDTKTPPPPPPKDYLVYTLTEVFIS